MKFIPEPTIAGRYFCSSRGYRFGVGSGPAHFIGVGDAGICQECSMLELTDSTSDHMGVGPSSKVLLCLACVEKYKLIIGLKVLVGV